ncbi:NmrA family NAD(P)-binding protein [Pseudoxanthomonas wuyuanensis]
MSTPTLLVTGASGHLGRATLAHLLDTLQVPAERIIATSRKPDALADLAARGVTVRAADFDVPASLEAAFAGAERLLLVSTDALLGPGKRLQQHQAAVQAAVAAGVGHMLYTSLPVPETSQVSFAPDHLGTEQALAASPLTWTVLRNAWYFENLLYTVPAALASGQWFSAAGEGAIAYIARDDLARAAAAALAADDTRKRTLTLTGAQALGAYEVATAVSALTGKPLQVVDVSNKQLIEGLQAHGFPPALAAVFASFDAATAVGDLGGITGDYAQLTGQVPESFEAWLTRNAGAFSAA